MGKWVVMPVKVATKTFYQAQRMNRGQLEKAGGYYERESIAERLCEALNATEEEVFFEDDDIDEF